MTNVSSISYNPNALLIDNTGLRKVQTEDEENLFTGVTSTANDAAAADEKDDGSIGFFGAIGNIFKGVGNFFKGMVCDENGNFSIGQCLKTVAIGALIAGATVLIPGAGAVISAGFLAMAGVHLGSAVYDVATAKTDAEAERAWQNVGSSGTEAAFAYVGAKKMGGLDLMKDGAHYVKGVGTDVANAYKANGLSEVSNVLSDHAHSAVDFAKTTYADTVKGTKTNWKNMTDAETRFQRNKQSYTDKAQQKAFEQGYDSMKSETSYETAYDNLKAFENQLKTAREAANKPNASKTAIDNYRKLSAKYDGMKTTLETRVNNGEFNALNKNGSVSKKAIAKLEKDVNTTKTKLDKVLADKNATPDEINTARAEYNRARSIKSAATKNSTFGDYSFRTISAIKDGRRMAGQNFITIAAAGNGLVA